MNECLFNLNEVDDYLHLVDEVDKPLFGHVVRSKNLHSQGLGDDSNDSGEITVVTAKDVLVVGFYQVRQKAVHKRSLIHVLCDWKPGKPE